MNDELKEKLENNIKECIGIPYMFGGNSPEIGFDCSGLMQYLYEQIGKNIPRTSQEQFKIGKIVNELEELKFGDLLFYNNANYVAMYIDENKILEAPHTGANVRISNIFNRNDYCGARKILE